MASKTALSAANLETLGAPRLAALLMELVEGDAIAKRRLRLELAATVDPKSVAREVRKRLSTIARSHGYIDWDKTSGLVQDLDDQRRAIVEKVARVDPAEALALMWRLLDLADGIYSRADDSNGYLGSVFSAACVDLGPLAEAAKPAPDGLARQVFEALKRQDYGQYDGLIEGLAPALGGTGMERLKALLTEWAATPIPTPPAAKRKRVGWSTGGPVFADELEVHHRDFTAAHALKTIADLQGDVDAFISQYSPEQQSLPRVAAGIAVRLLEAGRKDEALAALDMVGDHPAYAMTEWLLVRLEVLEALDRREEAQALRWGRFEETLDPHFLREYLDLLPDFEDDEAERRALDYAQAFSDAEIALSFLTHWNVPARIAALVRLRLAELNGRRYEILTDAAELLREADPWAATQLWRAMIKDTLDNSRSKRYGHAARHLERCAGVAAAIDDMAGVPDHDAFVEDLRARHGRKRAFWSKVDATV